MSQGSESNLGTYQESFSKWLGFVGTPDDKSIHANRNPPACNSPSQPASSSSQESNADPLLENSKHLFEKGRGKWWLTKEQTDQSERVISPPSKTNAKSRCATSSQQSEPSISSPEPSLSHKSCEIPNFRLSRDITNKNMLKRRHLGSPNLEPKKRRTKPVMSQDTSTSLVQSSQDIVIEPDDVCPASNDSQETPEDKTDSEDQDGAVPGSSRNSSMIPEPNPVEGSPSNLELSQSKIVSKMGKSQVLNVSNNHVDSDIDFADAHQDLSEDVASESSEDQPDTASKLLDESLGHSESDMQSQECKSKKSENPKEALAPSQSEVEPILDGEDLIEPVPVKNPGSDPTKEFANLPETESEDERPCSPSLLQDLPHDKLPAQAAAQDEHVLSQCSVQYVDTQQDMFEDLDSQSIKSHLEVCTPAGQQEREGDTSLPILVTSSRKRSRHEVEKSTRKDLCKDIDSPTIDDQLEVCQQQSEAETSLPNFVTSSRKRKRLVVEKSPRKDLCKDIDSPTIDDQLEFCQSEAETSLPILVTSSRNRTKSHPEKKSKTRKKSDVIKAKPNRSISHHFSQTKDSGQETTPSKTTAKVTDESDMEDATETDSIVDNTTDNNSDTEVPSSASRRRKLLFKSLLKNSSESAADAEESSINLSTLQVEEPEKQQVCESQEIEELTEKSDHSNTGNEPSTSKSSLKKSKATNIQEPQANEKGRNEKNQTPAKKSKSLSTDQNKMSKNGGKKSSVDQAGVSKAFSPVSADEMPSRKRRKSFQIDKGTIRGHS